MTDERARRAERQSLTTGAPADEAVVLRERLRRGALDEQIVQLAARMGHAGAALALGISPPPLPGSFVELHDWARPICESSRATLLLLHELSAEVLPIWTKSHPGGDVLERLFASAARHPRGTAEEIDALEGELTDLGDSAYGSWTSGRQPFEELHEVFVLLYEELRQDSTQEDRLERVETAAGNVLAMGESLPSRDGVPLRRAAERAARRLLSG